MSKSQGKNWVSVAVYAKRRGVSPKAIHKLIERGIIKKLKMKIEIGQADAAIKNNTDPLKAKKILSQITGDEEVEAGEEVEGDLTYIQARTELAREKAIMAKLERLELEGELVRVSAVERDAHALGITLKNAFLDLPDRIASVLAAESDEKKIYKILDTEIRGVLERLNAKK